MVFEVVDRGPVATASPTLESKLYESSYPDAPKDADGNKGNEAKDRQPEAAETPNKPEEKEAKETPEQQVDRKIKETFGADVLDNLKDWDWLIDNRKKLEAGFKKATGRDAWDMAVRIRELSTVDGKPLIYMEKVDGRTAGNLIPKRYDVYLRRGSLRSDNYIGHVYH